MSVTAKTIAIGTVRFRDRPREAALALMRQREFTAETFP